MKIVKVVLSYIIYNCVPESLDHYESFDIQNTDISIYLLNKNVEHLNRLSLFHVTRENGKCFKLSVSRAEL